VDPVPDPLLLKKSGSAGHRTRTSVSVTRNSAVEDRQTVGGTNLGRFEVLTAVVHYLLGYNDLRRKPTFRKTMRPTSSGLKTKTSKKPIMKQHSVTSQGLFVGTAATNLVERGTRVRFQTWARDLNTDASRLALGPTQGVAWAPSLLTKGQGHEADNSSPVP
jgi:hypothetical protein